jgi:hypothetical protein
MKKQKVPHPLKINNSLSLCLLAFSIILCPGLNARADYAAVVITDTPVHYWPLQETNTAQPAADLGAPGGNPGTYTQDVPGGIMLGQSTAPLTLGGTCPFFDGANGTFVNVGLFHPGNSMTIEAWINIASDASATYKPVIARWDGSYELDVTGTDVGNFDVYSAPFNSANIVAIPNALTRGQWYYYVGIYDSNRGNVYIYLNGVLMVTQTLPVGGVLQNRGANTPDRVLIASTRSGSAGYNFRGLIAQVAVYNYPLTSQQVQNHYNTGINGSGGIGAAPVLNRQAAISIQWPNFGGYDLEFADRFGALNWMNYSAAPNGTPVIATGLATSMVVVPASGTARFYRTISSSIFHP